MSINPINLNQRNIRPSSRVKKAVPRRFVWLAGFFVVLALVSGGLGAALALVMTSRPLQQKQLTAAEASVFQNGENDLTTATAGLPELTRPVNVLVLGTIVLTSDLPGAAPAPAGQPLAQVNSTLDGLSDAILLVRFDPTIKKVTAISVPRDSRVEIPEHGIGKINAANYLGGAALSAKTISQTLGNVTIDRYIRINVNGFGQLVDALGGVDIYVPKRMKYQDDSQRLYINLNAGQQHLDGNKAIQYMRYRHDDLGDIGRVQRQQTLLRALIEQKLNLKTVANLPQILKVLQQNIDTNLSVEELLALAAFSTKTDRKDARMLMVPGRFSEPDEYPLSYWILDERHLLRLMADHFSVQIPSKYLTEQDDHSPKYLRVAIQDSVNKAEGVAKASSILSEAGYGQVFPAEVPWAKPLQKTQIIAQQGDRASAEEVRKTLGIGRVVLESTGSLESDVTVRLGTDWLEKLPRKDPKTKGNSKAKPKPNSEANLKLKTKSALEDMPLGSSSSSQAISEPKNTQLEQE